MIEILLVIVLAGVIVGLFVERHITLKALLEKIDNSLKAIMSKNADEYSFLLKEPSKEVAPIVEKKDEVFAEQLTDEEFLNHIRKQTL